MACFQTILWNTGWSMVAKIASTSMQIFLSLFKMTANRRGDFPDLYFLIHILLTVRKFHVHGYATHLRPVVHFVLLASCCHVLIANFSLVLVIATGRMLFVGWKDMKSQSHRAATLAMFNQSDAKNRVDSKLLEQAHVEKYGGKGKKSVSFISTICN